MYIKGRAEVYCVAKTAMVMVHKSIHLSAEEKGRKRREKMKKVVHI